MSFIQKLTESHKQGKITDKIYNIFLQLYKSYSDALKETENLAPQYDKTFLFLLHCVEEQLLSPYQFEPYHQKITSPINYQQFALDFTRPLVDLENSLVLYPHNVEKIQRQIAQGENVILLANHQTEIDPQLIHILLEKTAYELASNIIFVAGDRVLTDPMAAPFSMGCNLICIYSKRHIDHPPERRAEKQTHNQKTMRRLVELFEEGGKCIYVAPAGGRDRPNAQGVVEVAPFDPQSIEIFRLMAQKSKKPVHFYPLALSTFDILPPPKQIQSELGERRKTTRHKVMLSFGDEIVMEELPGISEENRHEARELRAQAIFRMVEEQYNQFKNM